MDGVLDIPTAEVFLPLVEADEARYLAAHGGRGSAKSHFFADSLVDKCMTNPRTRWICVREHQISLKHSVKQLIEDKIDAHGVRQYFDSTLANIKTPGGGIIIFQGMKNHTADSIKSVEDFDGAWVEEAQSLSQRSLTMLRPTLRKAHSQLWFSWNPDQPTDPVDDFFRGSKEKPPNSAIVKVNYQDNPWFGKTSLREDMEYDKRRDIDRYDHVWMGGYNTKSEARVFRNWRVGELTEFEALKNDRARMYGADWGFSIDPTVLVESVVKGRTLYITREAYKIGLEIDQIIKFWSSIIPEAALYTIIADSARPETISYLRKAKNGYPKMLPAVKGANSVQEGIEFLRAFDIVVHPDCVYAIDELTHYSYKIDPKTMLVLPVLEDKKNHVIDSLRYMVEPLRRPKGGVLF